MSDVVTKTSARALALDVGDRRIGIAVTDALGLTAQPLFTLHRAAARADVKSIVRFARKHEVSTVVVGLPLNADGTQSRQAEKTQAFTATLQEAMAEALPGVEFVLLDERLTTRDAHQLLDAAGLFERRGSAQVSRAARLERSEIIDQVAAALLLEAWLSQRNGVTLLPGKMPDDLSDEEESA